MNPVQEKAGIKIEKPDPARLKELGALSWPIWTKEPSEFPWHYDDREVCYFLAGDVTVETGGTEVVIGKGDLVTFPKGMDCKWIIRQTVRKHYNFG